MSDQKKIYGYVGNWDKDKTPLKDAFLICRYDRETGALAAIKSVFPGISVGNTCLDARRGILYCTDEVTTHDGYYRGGGGQVYAFAVDRATGDLTHINHKPSYGSLPSYPAVDAKGEYLIVTHHTDRNPVTRTVGDAAGGYRITLQYDDANTVLFPLGKDGSIGDPCDIYTHSGDGGPLQRQTHPQLHSVMMSPSGTLFAVCDKGNDRIVMFRIDRQARKLQLCNGEGHYTIPGSTPRYTAFHPTRPFLYVNYEFKAVVGAFRYDEDGKLEAICTVSALPEGCKDNMEMKQSDLRIHPSGKYLYDLIRGIDSVSVFAIDEQTGAITKIQTVTLDGTGPRGAAISPDGRFLHIAAWNSEEVLAWAISEHGTLTPTGLRTKCLQAGSVTFFPPSAD